MVHDFLELRNNVNLHTPTLWHMEKENWEMYIDNETNKIMSILQAVTRPSVDVSLCLFKRFLHSLGVTRVISSGIVIYIYTYIVK